MDLSIVEQIALKVKSRLAALSSATGGVIRPTRLGGFQPRDYQIVFKQGDSTPNEALSHPGNPPSKAWNLPFMVAGALRPSEKDKTPNDTIKNQFSADVQKALTTGTNWWNFDGLAIDAQIGAVEDYESDDGSESGFQIPFVVTYRIAENDPYLVRT